MLKPHIWVEDITDHPPLVDLSTWLCSLAYSRLYGKSEDGGETVPYETWEAFSAPNTRRARVLMAFGQFETNESAEVLGTSTIRFGNQPSQNGGPPLEFMHLFEADGGWEQYDEHGFDANRIVEGARLAFSPRCEKNTPESAELRVQVYRHLYETTRLLGMQRGCDQVWGIVPRHVAVFAIRRCQMRSAEALRTRPNSGLHSSFFKLYSRYWVKGKPRLYRSFRVADQCRNPISGEEITLGPKAGPTATMFRLDDAGHSQSVARRLLRFSESSAPTKSVSRGLATSTF